MAENELEEQKRRHRIEEFDYVRFTWSDINGVARSKLVPRAQVAAATENGVGAYAGILAFGPRSQPVVPLEVQASRHGNTIVKPDLETLHPVRWSGSGSVEEFSVGGYLCHTYWQDGCPQEACPRTIAEVQCKRLEDRGLSLLSAFEMEFSLLDVDSKPAWTDHGIFCNVVTSKFEPLFFQIERAVRESGVDIECIQAEYSPGQCEFSLAPKTGINSADHFFLTKQAIKEIAQEHGLTATCMSKPFAGEAGNGAHFNHSLWTLDGKMNLFNDPQNEDGISLFALHWLEGLSRHAGALTALCCPTVNCYRRIHGQWAPRDNSWGKDDRRTTFRVKHSLSSKSREMYIENRLPGGCANPYIVLAATVAAGLDGIDQAGEKEKAKVQKEIAVTGSPHHKVDNTAESNNQQVGSETNQKVNPIGEYCKPEQARDVFKIKEHQNTSTGGQLQRATDMADPNIYTQDTMTTTRWFNAESELLPFTLEEAMKALEKDRVLVSALGEEFVRWFCQSKREVDLKELQSSNVNRPADSFTEEEAMKERHMYSVFM